MYNLDGLLADGYQTPLGIDVAKMLQYDWMRTLLVAGCWNIEAGALVAALKPLGHTQKICTTSYPVLHVHQVLPAMLPLESTYLGRSTKAI